MKTFIKGYVMNHIGITSPRFVGMNIAFWPTLTGMYFESPMYFGRQLALFGEVL